MAAGADLNLWTSSRRNHLIKDGGRLIPLAGELSALSLTDALMGAQPTSIASLRGPPTVVDTVRSVCSPVGGNFTAANNWWLWEAHIDLSKSTHEHRVSSRALDLA